MKRRDMKGIAQQTVSFGDVDHRPFAPLHRRMGISTYTHRQAVLAESNHAFAQPRGWDSLNRVWSDNHLYRVSITLPRVA